ncbi:hypothetical protein AGMMS49525_15700 [Bacteroidia bacterium]|nr:hypothetical protein AGMMS49525_15700 [Bacteroidia bacterium]
MLSDIESDLETHLKITNKDNEYVIIYIATNDNDVEINDFGDVIRENILKDIQYVYMTNLSDAAFKNGLKKKIFRNGTVTNDYLLNAAYAKNIHHISNADFFKYRPAYSDMVIYTKYQYNPRTGGGEVLYDGYFCYQNDAIKEIFKIGDSQREIKHYYYYKMLDSMAKEIIADCFQKKFWNSVLKSWSSDKIELKDSNINGKGLFAKCLINKDEEIFTMGGEFEKLQDVKNKQQNGNTFLQINEKICLCGIDTEDKDVKFCANHSCTPNCKLKDEITFVALKDIGEGEEILVDYVKLGDKYCIVFDCANKQCDFHNGCSHNIQQSEKHKTESVESDIPFIKTKTKTNKNNKK